MEMLFAFAGGILIGSIVGLFIARLLFSAEDNDDMEQEEWIKEYNSRRKKIEGNQKRWNTGRI